MGLPRIFGILIFALAALTSCTTLVSNPTEIVDFTASADRVSPNDYVILSWTVNNLDGGTLRLTGESRETGERFLDTLVTGQDKLPSPVPEAATFTLIASGPNGTTSKSVRVDLLEEPEPGEPVIERFTSSSGAELVAPGQEVLLEWLVVDADQVHLEPVGEAVGLSGELLVSPESTTTYTLIATNEVGSVEATVTVLVAPENETGKILLLIAGQSNASGSGLEDDGQFPTGATEQPQEGVWMMEADGDWVLAAEPTHPGNEHSFGVRLGKELLAATGHEVYLVPAAVGGTRLSSWQPGQSNFENAVARAEQAAAELGVPVSAVVWFQGESDTKWSDTRNNFITNTDNVLKAFHERLTGAPEILMVQLSKRLDLGPGDVDETEEGHNLAYQDIREKQRLMEAGAVQLQVGTASPAESTVDRDYYHLVVAHDLPMSDDKHVSAEGQRYLGRRIANAFLNRVWVGEVAVSHGEGPRLERVTLSEGNTVVTVDTTQPINASSTYDGYFTVFVDGAAVPYGSIGRDPADPTAVRIVFPSPLSGNVQVRYMPPDDTGLYDWSDEAVHSTVGGLKLPLPAFGMAIEDYGDVYFPGVRIE